jgi:predicted metal-dependent hydrolase
MAVFVLGNRKIRYVVRKAPDSKYAQLKLTPNHPLEVIVPVRQKINVKQLLKKKRKWIESKFDEMLKSKKIFDSRRLLYRGTYHNVIFGSALTKRIRVSAGKIILPPSNGMDWKEIVKNWMRHQTKRLVDKRLNHYTHQLGLSFANFSVRDTRKWAYCTRDGKVVFNSQLIALPQELADYVILHEITHLEEFNHSKRFRYKLASICPDFKERELMLKQFVAD